MTAITDLTAPAPFVGLRPFQTTDAAWFFGRERESIILARKVRGSPFTAVVGASGSGKSSLVLAGVLPALQADGWRAIVAKPGSAPIASLAKALADAGAEKDDRLAKARMFQFDASLRASAFGLAAITATLAAEVPSLVLVVDQFEELFRYGEEAGGSERAAMREEGRAFVELLLKGATRVGGRLHVVLTMRSDYFGICSLYQGLAEAVSASQYLVPVPERDQLESAIRGPVEKVGATIEDGLVQRLLVDVEEETDRLPLLQHTLRRLWEQATGEPRTLSETDYVAVGRLAGSIDWKAEAVLKALTNAHPEDADTTERVMKALTQLDEHDRATRRAQRKSELLAVLADDPGRRNAATRSLDRVLLALAAEDVSFLQLGYDTDPEVDIGHEALIRSWRRLAGQELNFKSGWLCEERKDGERWREYVRRASEGPPLSIRGQSDFIQWLRRRRFSPAWAQRYGNAWNAISDLYRFSRKRSISQIAAIVFAGAIVLITPYALPYMWNYLDPHREKVAEFDALITMKKEAARVFDDVTEELLPAQEEHRWLRDTLIHYKQLLPPGYGIKEPQDLLEGDPEEVSQKRQKSWVLKHSSQRHLDSKYFHHRWRSMASMLIEDYGIPAPMDFELEVDDKLMPDEVKVQSPNHEEGIIYNIERHEDGAVIDSRNVQGNAQQFMELFKEDWSKITVAPKRWPYFISDWLSVPRWSLPVWKAARVSIIDGSEVTAVLLARHFLDKPDAVLNPNVQLLLDRLASSYPNTVAEARLAQGELLSQDLAEAIIQDPGALKNLPVLLDGLAEFPQRRRSEVRPNSVSRELPTANSVSRELPTVDIERRLAEQADPAAVVASVIEGNKIQRAVRLPEQLYGPWPDNAPVVETGFQKGTDPTAVSFGQIEKWITSVVQPPIRVYLGRNLEDKARMGETGLVPELQEKIDRLRDKVFLDTGINVPGIKFNSAQASGARLEPWQFKIEFLGQPVEQTFSVNPDRPLDDLIGAIASYALKLRARWLLAEDVSSLLQKINPQLRVWLTKHYSLTDLKLLLRGVVESTSNEMEPGHTIRHSEWLLGSLVFWTQNTPVRDALTLVERLRRTQSKRPAGNKAFMAFSDQSSAVARGIRALSEGRIEDAETLFREAGQGDAAAESFLAIYPSQVLELTRKQSEQECSSNLDSIELQRAQWINLQDVILSLPEATSGSHWRRSKLCLLAGTGSKLRPKDRATLLRSLLVEARKPNEWPVEEAAYFGTLLVKEHDPLSSNDSNLAAAEHLLGSALRRLNDQQAATIFGKITEICRADGPKAWCWGLADNLAKVSGDWRVLADFALDLSQLEPRRYLRRALEIVKMAEEDRSSAALPPVEDEWIGNILTYSRAIANKNLAALGEPYEDPESMLRKVIASLDSPLLKEYSSDFQIDVHIKLIELLNEEERFNEAIDLAKEALVRWPDNPYLLVSRFWIAIAKGDFTAMADAASALAAKAKDNKELLFHAAIGGLLTGENTDRHDLAREFLETKDPYVRYVALLLMAFESDESRGNAKGHLKRLWDAADRERWEVRLRHGDPNVWREMLNGYALNYLTRDKLYAPLKDEAAFEASSFSNLPLSLPGMSCEFHFYDALIAKMNGDRARMLHELQEAINTQYHPYHEYKMAKFLLKRETKSKYPPSTAGGSH